MKNIILNEFKDSLEDETEKQIVDAYIETKDKQSIIDKALANVDFLYELEETLA